MKLLKPSEAADMLRISVRKLSDLMYSGEIPRYKVGGQNRIKEEDLLRYLARNRA